MGKYTPSSDFTQYTEEQIASNGATVKAKITNEGFGNYRIELVSNGVIVTDEPEHCIHESNAFMIGRQMVYDYMAQLDSERNAQPADVDQGGDFEGFLEAVQAEPEPPFVQTGDNGPWYTLPVITADGHRVQSVITKSTVGGFLVTCGAIGTKVDSFRAAIEAGDDLARAELERVNGIRAAEMDRNPWDYDEDETRVENHDRMAAINRKHARIEEIRRSLARLDRERDSLTFELAQLVGE